MSPLALLLPLLCGFATPPLLSQDAGRALTPNSQRVISDDALRVVTADPVLGEEIARAARRYVRGPILVEKTGENPAEDARQSAGGSDAAGEQTAVLRVQRAGGGAASERWELVLTLGRVRVAHRTITVHGAATRFDLAEAVAIGLPDMLAGLSNSSAAKPPSAPSGGSGPRPVLARPSPAGAAPGRRAVGRIASSRGVLPESPPRRHVVAEPRSAPQEDGHANPETLARPAPVAVAASVPPASAADSQPRSTGEAGGAAGSQSPTEETGGAANVATAHEPGAPSEKPPVAKSAALAAAPPLPTPPVELPARVSTGTRTPAGAIVLTASGAVGLFAGLATGSAALLAARQVDSPIGGRFDAGLDRRGRALDTATLVLDVVGGAALIAGGSWLIYHVVKTRRAAPTLVPLAGGAAVSLRGAF